jgi:hypothetical protein
LAPIGGILFSLEEGVIYWAPSLTWRTEKMNGHVFQCFNKCEDKKLFSKTVEALGEYIAKKLKYPGDMVSLTKDFVGKEGVCLLHAH